MIVRLQQTSGAWGPQLGFRSWQVPLTQMFNKPPPGQSSSPRHATQAAATASAPFGVLQRGLEPVQAPQARPQWLSTVQAVHVLVERAQNLPLPVGPH